MLAAQARRAIDNAQESGQARRRYPIEAEGTARVERSSRSLRTTSRSPNRRATRARFVQRLQSSVARTGDPCRARGGPAVPVHAAHGRGAARRRDRRPQRAAGRRAGRASAGGVSPGTPSADCTPRPRLQGRLRRCEVVGRLAGREAKRPEPRGQRGMRRARAAPGAASGRAGHDDTRRRLQLPHADRAAGRQRTAGAPSGGAAGRARVALTITEGRRALGPSG